MEQFLLAIPIVLLTVRLLPTAGTDRGTIYRDNRSIDKEFLTNQRHKFRPPRATVSKRPQHFRRSSPPFLAER